MSSSASLLRHLAPRLAKHYGIAAFDRRGHGRTRDSEAPFHYEAMADETIAFLEYLGEPSHLVGHSDGGVVALIVAKRRPDLVRRAVVVGANYHVSGVRPMPAFDLDGVEFVNWANQFAQLTPDGVEHARIVAQKSQTLLATEPTMSLDDLRAINVPVLVMAGDDDVIELAHTCSMYEALREGQLAIVPGTSHAVLKERPGHSAKIIRHFLNGASPPVTLTPCRRTGSE